MSGADSMVDAEGAVREYLLTEEVNSRITASADRIDVVLYEFNSDSPRTSLMVRDSGGVGETYMRLDNAFVQVWVRSSDPDDAKKIIARVDDELHQLGPKAISSTVYCLKMLRNTGRQRLDDPHNKLVQYFIIYDTTMRRIS